MIAKVTAVILAGGKSSRFGSDKAFIKIGGASLIRKQIKILKKIFKKIIVVTNTPAKYKLKNVKVIRDIIPGLGPLSGIHAGLSVSDSFYNFVVACDMPFITLSLIRYIMKNKKSYDIIIPKIDRKYHPLFGVYSKNCIPVIEKALKGNRLNVSAIFPKVKTGFIFRKEIERFDKPLLSLKNINTEDDLAMLKMMIPGANRNCAGVVSVHKELKTCQRTYFKR
ncbi:MAG: molybdenum cofactor guanylyltransferase [Candidatus Omnitrophota bacterium]